MPDLATKQYLAIVQCDIVMQRCSGYFCEKALHERTGGFAVYPAEQSLRHVMLTCGGCCGLALQRKLVNLCRKVEQAEGIARSQIAVQLASCITKDNYHGPPCPHLAYLRTLIERIGLEVVDDTAISHRSETLREAGVYES